MTDIKYAVIAQITYEIAMNFAKKESEQNRRNEKIAHVKRLNKKGFYDAWYKLGFLGEKDEAQNYISRVAAKGAYTNFKIIKEKVA